MIRRALILFLGVFLVHALASQNTIDSLENYAKIAKPGWDQIDIAVGLGRLYIGSGELDKGRTQIERINALSEEYNLPSARSYGLILENLIAYLHNYDSDAAINFCQEAIRIAKETNNRDALVYASYQLAENYIYEKGDNEKGRDVLLGLVPVIDKTVSLKNQGSVHKNLGYVYGLLGEYEKGLNHFYTALDLFNEIVENPPIDPKINRVSAQLTDPLAHVGYTHNYIGDLLVKQGNTSEAIEQKEKALEVLSRTINKGDIAWMHNNLSKAHSSIGEYKKALDYIQNAKSIFEKLDFPPEIARSNSTMIDLLINLGDYREAERLSIKNLNYYKEVDHQLFYASTLLVMTNIQISLNQLDLADKYLKEAEALIGSMDNEKNKVWLMQVKGKLAKEKKNWDIAESAFRNAIQLSKELEDEFRLGTAQYQLAEIFHLQNLKDSSLFYAEMALIKSTSLDNTKLRRDCYLLLSKIYEVNEDYESAFRTYRNFFQFHDSVYTADAQLKLKEEQVRQNVNEHKSERELAEQNAQILTQRNRTYLILGVALLCVLVLMVYFFVNLRKVKTRIESQNNQLAQLNHTKDKFFGIIAHDLRSPLLGLESVGEQIDYLVKKKEPEKLKELSAQIDVTSKKLTELLDNLLSWALLQNGMVPYHPERINLKEELDSVIELLSPFAQMKQIQLVNAIEDEVFVFADSKAVNTIFRNLVSNALKFTNAEGQVKVEVAVEENRAEIMINDTGTGIATEQLDTLFEIDKKTKRGTLGEKGTGLGLILCKELVELNKGTIKVISDLGKGSSFIFNLPTA